MMKADDFDHCIIGTCRRAGQDDIIAYDIGKIYLDLCGQGMSLEEAVEYFEFNILGAWVGDQTPCFIDTDSE